jgi:mutator protein MutT
MRQKVAGDVLERLLAVMEQKKREMVLLQGKPREATASMSARNVSVLILYKADGKILLQHRSKDAPTLPDHWSFFGGGVEEGESPEQAVRREAVEELGYQLASPRLFSVKQIAVEKRELTLHVFVERYDGGLLTQNSFLQGQWAHAVSLYFGRISYPVYLFHLVVLYAMSRLPLQQAPSLQFFMYVMGVLLLTTIFFYGVEKPILASRPRYP